MVFFSLVSLQHPYFKVSTSLPLSFVLVWASRVAAILRGVHNGPGVYPLVVGAVRGQGRGVQACFVRDRAHGQASRHGGTVARIVHHLFVGLEVHFVRLVVVVAVVVLLLRGHKVVDGKGVVEGVVVLRLKVGLGRQAWVMGGAQ